MKVLVAHNFYRSGQPSGENEAVSDDVVLLRAAGVEVIEHFAFSDTIDDSSLLGKALVAPGPVVNVHGLHRFVSAIDRHRPDVVHVHNLQPLISPAVIPAARRRAIPVVHTVHNYRHACIAGTLFRQGHHCEDCVQSGTPAPGVRNACYRGSTTQSMAAAMGQVIHQRTWRRLDRYLVLTRYMANLLERIGLPRDRFVLRPTAVADPGSPAPLGQDILFVGRLDEGKGIRTLVDAWSHLPVVGGRRLRIAGSGPLQHLARGLAGARPDVTFMGQVPRERVTHELHHARAVVMPSKLQEGFPRVLAEAFAHGRPVLVARGGNLADIAPEDCAYHFGTGPASLAAALRAAQTDDGIAAKGRAARARYLSSLTPEVSAAVLLDCYRSLIESDPAGRARAR